MFDQFLYTTPMTSSIQPSYLDTSIYPNFIPDHLSPSYEYCFSPTSNSFINPATDILGSIECDNMFTSLNSSFDSMDDYQYILSSMVPTFLPIVRPNAKTMNIKRRGSYFSLNSYQGKRVVLYQCDICNKTFNRKYVLKRHKGSHTNNREYYCLPCKMGFYRKDIYERHLITNKCKRAHKLL